MAFKVNTSLFTPRTDDQQQAGGFQPIQERKFTEPESPGLSPEDEQGIIADFIDKFQQGAWGAAADVVTGARGLLTDDRVWEMEQLLRDQVAAQEETLSTAQKEADAGFSMFGDGEFTGRGFGGALFQGAGSLIPSVGLGIATGGAGAVASKALGMGAKVGQVGGGALAGAPMIGGGAMNQVREELDTMPEEEFTTLPDFDLYYQTAMQQSPDDPIAAMKMAREIYTQDAEQEAVKQGAAVGAVSMGAAVPMLDKIVRGGAGVVGGAQRGAGTEFLQEGFESGGQEAVVNPLVGRERFEGVPEAAATGAVLGGIIGGAAGGVGGLRRGPTVPGEPDLEDVAPAGPELPPYTETPLIRGGQQPVTAERRERPFQTPGEGREGIYPTYAPGPTQAEQREAKITSTMEQEYQRELAQSDVQKIDQQEIPLAEFDNDPVLIRQALNEGLVNVDEAEQALDIIAKTPAPVEPEIKPDLVNIPKPDKSILEMNRDELADYRTNIDTYEQSVVQAGDPNNDLQAVNEIQNRLDILERRAKEPVELIKGREETDLEARRAKRGVKPEPKLDEVAKEAATHPDNELPEPTEAQLKAGKYKMAHPTVQGMKVSIENPKGSTRKGEDKAGKPWSVEMKDHYGYFKGTVGYDKDHLDVFMGPVAEQADNVFVVDQITPSTGKFDEHKVMMGYDSIEDAEKAYRSNYDKDWKGLDNITEMPLEKFKEWAYSDAPKKGALTPTKKTLKDVLKKKEPKVEKAAKKPEIKPEEKQKVTPEKPTVEKIAEKVDNIKNLTDKELRTELNKANDSEKIMGDRRTQEQKDYRKALIKESYDRAGEEQISVVTPKVEKPAEEAILKPKKVFTPEAQNQFDKDMAELGGAILDVLSLKAIPSDRKPEFTRLLTNVMGSALNLGYVKFKENAQYVLKTIGDKFGEDAAKLFDLQMLQGAYLGATSGEKGAEGIADVANVTLDDIKTTEEIQDELLQPDADRVPAAGRVKQPAAKKPTGKVRAADKERARPADDAAAARGKRPTVSKPPKSDSKTSDRSGATEYQGRSRDSVRHNHTIESQADLASGSAYQIAKTNLDAIKIATRIASSDNDVASDVEKSILAKYAGWGAGDIRNKVFPKNDKPEGRWKEIYDQLNELLTPAEMKTLKKSTQYAHYTSKNVVDAMYKAIDNFGFKTGAVFEGGVGSGNFMGMIPKKFEIPSYTGVEMDSITADIAQALYPDNRVIKGDFTKIALPENHFDLVIGNPPFADVRYKHGGQKMMVHDYFIAKQLDALRPGSVGTFVTSTGTMDKLDSSVREYIAENSVLLGAIRLPNDAFAESAKTKVTADVLFFQKKDPSRDDIKGVDWIESEGAGKLGLDINVNEYFLKNTGQMLGSPTTGGTFKNRFDLLPSGDTQAQLDKAIDGLPKNIIKANPSVEEVQARLKEFEIAPDAKPSNFYVDKDNNVRMVIGGVGTIVQNRKQHGRGKTVKQLEQVRDYIPLRNSLMKVMASQGNEGAWNKAIKNLNTNYDSFVKKHGYLNQVKITHRKDGKTIYQYPITSNLEDDAEFFRVSTSEQFNEDTGEGTKGDVFRDQLFGQKKPVDIKSAEDALSVTLNEKGYLDLDYLQTLYDSPVKEIIDELGTSIYKDPVTDQWITADDYLSGNVKAKLKVAQDAGIKRNIAALEKIIPEDKPLSVIPINLGAFWIDTDIIKQFAEEEMEFKGQVSNVIRGETSAWSVIGQADNTADFGTADRTPVQLLDAALNRKTVKVQYKDDAGKMITKVAETTAANEKIKLMRERFLSWAVNNDEASKRLHEVYNRDFNTTVNRQYDGSMLTLPGLSSKYDLHQWQKDVVWRIIQNGNTYMAHTVGAGKTLASIVAGQELKRLGLSEKPTYVVLKSTLKQFAAEFYDAYPNAKLLIADENQLNPRNRRHFLGKVANEQWDGIVMTHQSFEKVAMGDDFITKYIEEQIAQYKATLEEIDESDLPNRRTIENTIEKMEARLEEIAKGEGKDIGIKFEETGIDQLFVDEAHTHKKIQFPTAQSTMKGIDPQGSNIAMDMFLKSRYLNTLKPNKNLVLMSGTPVTNTIGEFFNIQRFLQPDVLEQNGTSSFDAWSSTFTEATTSYEMQASGQHKAVTRLNKFVGLPGLLRDFLEIADIVSDTELANSTTIKNRPTLKNNSRDIVKVPMGPAMEKYMKELEARITALENRKGPPKKGEDNILVVINDGRNSSIDMRLVGRTQDIPSKLDTMIDSAYNTWEETKNDEYVTNGVVDPIKGSVQLIFTTVDKTKHGSFSVYNHIKDTLIKKGVPAGEIAFIQDYNDSKKKKRLFNDVDAGKVRFVIGGTQNLGTGTNVQKRLAKINHLSIDYRPSDLIQREGRMIRQGNQNEEVESHAFVTEGTIDAFMWGLLESKAGMIDQAMSGDLSLDSITDVSNEQSALAMAKAIASGNPALLEMAELSSDVTRLNALESAYTNQRFKARRTLRDVETANQAIEYWQNEVKKLPKYKDTTGDNFNAEWYGKQYTDRKKFLEAMNATGKAPETGLIGKIGNIPLYAHAGSKDVNLHKTKGTLYVPGYYDMAQLNLDPVKLTGDLGFGAVKRIENAVRNYAAMGEELTESQEKIDKQKKNANKILSSEFDKTEELETKRTRLIELEKSLEAPAPVEEKLTDEDAVLESKAKAERVGEHPAFSFVGVGKPSGLSERQIFNIINDKYGRPLFGASKFRNLDIINDPKRRWRGQYNPKTKGMVLNAFYLTHDDAVKVLHHEKVHEHIRKDDELVRIANEIMARAKRYPKSPAGKALEIARDRVSKDTKNYDSTILEETLAYLVQYYNKPGHKSALKEYIAAIRKFFAKYIGVAMNEDYAVDYISEMVRTESKAYQDVPVLKTTKRGTMYSDMVKESALGDVAQKLAPDFETDWIDNTKSYVKRHLWGTLNVRQISEILGKYAPLIKDKYIDRFKLYESDMNEMKQIAGDIANIRQDLPRDINEKLAKVQSEATIEGYDPSFEKPEDDNQQSIKSDYLGLTAAAKKVYKEERDYHKNMHDTRLKELKNRINDIEGDQGFKELMIDKLTEEFSKASKNGPYFPLARFGQFWVSSENAAGEKSFDMFENETAQKHFVDQLRATPGEDVLGFGRQLDKLQEVSKGVDGKFIAEIDKLVKRAGGDDSLRDDIFQLYLESLPELSSRKKYLHRKKTKGFSKDQAKAFAHAARADANDIARIKHIHVLQDMIDQTETSLNIASSRTLKKQFENHAGALQRALDETPFEITDEDIADLNEQAPFKTFQLQQTGNPEAEIKRVLAKEKSLLKNAEKIDETKITFVSSGLSELKASHEAMVNANVHPIASGLNSLGFLWYLGASPAAALVNLTQTPTVALPMMLADKALKGSAGHLTKAVADFMKGKGSIEPTLNANEKKAFEFWHKSGLLENTQAHDLSGIADSGIDTGTFKNKAMRMISFMFHRAEVMNREVTALATYRAAIEGGMKPADAMKKASDLTWDSHLDYGASNRARFMRGNFARVITQFKQYSQGITYIYARTAFQAFKGESKADRQQAMKLLGMLIGSQISVAGTLGLPMAGIVMGIAQGLEDALGDDDDPVSIKAEFRQAMSDFAGKRGGQAISHGLIDAFTPLSVSGRLSMADLWVRTPDYDQEGKAEALSYIEALGGPMVSIFTNAFMAKGSLKQGEFLRAAESMTPKFIKDFVRSGRYLGEGNLTRAGLKIKDMTPAEMMGQALGFSASEVSEIRERATGIKNIERQRAARRKDIIDSWIADADGVMEEIQAWNVKHPRDRITGDTLRRAKRSKLRYARQVTKGVRETKRTRDLIEKYDY